MADSQGLAIGLSALLGLLVGSFLNVVIARLPRMMQRQWLQDACAALESNAGDAHSPQPSHLWQSVLGSSSAWSPSLAASIATLQQALDKLPHLGLARPRSHCPVCKHTIAWYDNIPLVSFLLLRGRCRHCTSPISLRYPAVEVVTAALFALCAQRWGLSLLALAWAAYAAILICQFLIDFDTQLLPDTLNYSLMWLGLLVAAGGQNISLQQSVVGAACGYLILWSFYHLYRLVTGKEGMGYGDFKLLAALGAWLGVDYLLALILLSSGVGAALGIALLIVKRIAHKDVPIAFGPFLAGAGLLCLVIGPMQVQQLMPWAFVLR